MMVILMMVMVMATFRCWRKKEQPDSCQESTIGTVGLAGLHQSNNVQKHDHQFNIVTTITAAFIIVTISSFSVLRFPDHPYPLQPHDLSPRHRFLMISTLVVGEEHACSRITRLVVRHYAKLSLYRPNQTRLSINPFTTPTFAPR